MEKNQTQVARSKNVYRMLDTLNVKELDKYIAYLSPLIGMEIQRKLTLEELSAIWALPTSLKLKISDVKDFLFPQFQAIFKVVESISSQLQRYPNPTLQRLKSTSMIKIKPEKSFTYLKDIKKNLDHKWVQLKSMSSSAAKSDDAEVNFQLWNQRITLIWPQFEPHLNHVEIGY